MGMIESQPKRPREALIQIESRLRRGKEKDIG